MKTQLSKYIAVVFPATVIVGLFASTNTVWAAKKNPVLIHPPYDYELDSRCAPMEAYKDQIPDDYKNYFNFCGSFRSVGRQRGPLGGETTGQGIDNLVVVFYKGIRNTRFHGVLGYTKTNTRGFFSLPIPKLKKVYMAVFSFNGDELILKDSYELSPKTLKDSKSIIKNFTTGIAAYSLDTALGNLDVPDEVSYVIEDGPLECGEEKVSKYLPEEYETWASKTLNVLGDPDTYYKEYTESNPFWPGADGLSGIVAPEEANELSRDDIEGRMYSQESIDRNVYTLSNIYLTGSEPMYVETYGDEKTLPGCNSPKITDMGSITGQYNMNLTGGIMGMLLEPDLEKIEDTISDDLLRGTPVCVDEEGAIRTLSEFDKTDPIYIAYLAKSIGNVNNELYFAPQEQKDKSPNDSLENTDPSLCRRYAFDLINNPSQVPDQAAQACATVRIPGANMALSQFSDAFDETHLAGRMYTPVGAEEEDSRFPMGIKRIGTVQPLCTCSILDPLCEEPVSKTYNRTDNDKYAASFEIVSPKVVVNPIAATTLFGTNKAPGHNLIDIMQLIKDFLRSLFSSGYGTTDEEIRDAIRDNDPCFALDSTEVDEDGDCLENDDFCEVEYVDDDGKPCDPVQHPHICNPVYYKELYKYICEGTQQAPLEVAVDLKKPATAIPLVGSLGVTTVMRSIVEIPGSELKSDVGSYNVIVHAATKAPDMGVTMKEDPLALTGKTIDTDALRFATQISLIDPQKFESAVIFPEDFPMTCEGEAWEEWFGGEEVDISSDAYAYLEANRVGLNMSEISMDAYAYAEKETGIPCEIVAGVHFIEGGNNPNQSVEDGSPINPQDLRESAKGVAGRLKLYIQNGGCTLVPGLPAAPIDDSTAVSTFAGALSCRGGGGNSQCFADPGLTNWESNCPREYMGEDDPYGIHLLTDRHTDMSLIYPLDGVTSGEFCSGYCPGHILCSSCPPPIPFIRPGALTTAIYFHGTDE